VGRGENQRSTAIRQVVKMLKTWPAKSLMKFFCGLLCVVSLGIHAEPPLVLRVAAASDLRDALNAISHEFQQTEPGIPVQIVFGSSGKLSQQIQHVHLMISISLQICISPNSYGKKVLPSKLRLL